MTRISRHFNYTHRVRIPASKIHVEIERGEDGKYRGIVKSSTWLNTVDTPTTYGGLPTSLSRRAG